MRLMDESKLILNEEICTQNVHNIPERVTTFFLTDKLVVHTIHVLAKSRKLSQLQFVACVWSAENFKWIDCEAMIHTKS